MSNKKEILTFQFGNYSNYVGAHWWNIQESGFSYDPLDTPSEIDHDVLYREGQTINGQTTYTPRLLLVDLNGSLKHLPLEGELYGNHYKRLTEKKENEDITLKLQSDVDWDTDKIKVEKEPEAKKHEFQEDLDKGLEKKNYDFAEDVESWADYLNGRYHPRTTNIIGQYVSDPKKQTFDTFSCGVQLWKTAQFEEDFSDKIRQYIEECDYLQGFQTLFDSFNGFSGLATQCLEYLNDEYSKANFVVPLYSPQNTVFRNADETMSDSIRTVNSALTFHKLIEQSSLFIPLSTQGRVWRQLGDARRIRYLDYKTDNLYQTSAILASYLDTISLRYRLKNAPASNSLSGFCGDLNNYGRKLAAAALALPFPIQHDMDLIDCLDKFEGDLFTQLTPNCSVGTDYIVQTMCVRGIPSNRLKRPLESAKEQMRMAAYKCESVSEMFQLYLQCINHASMAHVASIGMRMPTMLPYPYEIFTKDINCDGFLFPLNKTVEGDPVKSVPTLATAQSSSELGDTLETLHREAKRVKISKLHRFKAAGLEEDDYAEALEHLLLFKDEYNDNMQL